MILAMRVSPRPLRTWMRVVVACAMMLPPMGFTLGPAKMLPPSRLAWTTYAKCSARAALKTQPQREEARHRRA
jgi:hypothetical protein